MGLKTPQAAPQNTQNENLNTPEEGGVCVKGMLRSQDPPSNTSKYSE